MYTVICYGNHGNLGFIAYRVFALTSSMTFLLMIKQWRDLVEVQNYSGTSLKGLSELRIQYKNPPY